MWIAVLFSTALAGVCSGITPDLILTGSDQSVTINPCGYGDDVGVAEFNPVCGTDGEDYVIAWTPLYTGRPIASMSSGVSGLGVALWDGTCSSRYACATNNSSGHSREFTGGETHYFVVEGGTCGDVTITVSGCNTDSDGDGTCDEEDPCFGDDSTLDSDNDGICNDQDTTCDLAPITDLGSTVGTAIATGYNCDYEHGFGSSNVETECRDDYGEGELLYTWSAPYTGTYTFQQTGDMPILQLRDQNDCAEQEIACSLYANTGPTETISVEATLTAGEPLYLVLDADACGDYTLDILGCDADTDGDGVCDGSDDCLGDDALGDADGDGYCEPVLTVDPLSPGAWADFVVEGAPAGERVFFLLSTRPPGRTCHPTASVCADLQMPLVLGSQIADGTGMATISRRVPNNAPLGSPVAAQAMWVSGSGGEVSPRVETTVQ